MSMMDEELVSEPTQTCSPKNKKEKWVRNKQTARANKYSRRVQNVIKPCFAGCRGGRRKYTTITHLSLDQGTAYVLLCLQKRRPRRCFDVQSRIVPATKRLDDERLKEKPRITAVDDVLSEFFHFCAFWLRRQRLRRPVVDCTLSSSCWDNINIEGPLLSILSRKRGPDVAGIPR